MAKKESTLSNMVFSLLIITAVSSASLGFLHQLTKEPKSIAEKIKQNFAIQRVLPEHNNEPSADAFVVGCFDCDDQLTCYPASQNGELVGIAVDTWTMNGYSGLVRLMVGFDKTGNIINISVLEQRETPGLGTKMADAEFKDQYKGKNPCRNNLAVKKDHGEIDAITAATISSRAFSEAVMRAYKSLEKADKFEK